MPIISKELPSQAELHRLFEYADTGELIWRPRPVSDFKNQRACNTWNAQLTGKVAGYINKSTGYRYICVDAVRFLAHRLIYAWHHGACPADLQIDHRDGDRSNNRVGNLRLATHAENSQNSVKRSDNTSGHRGVCWDKQTQKFQAQIKTNNRNKHLGYFQSAEEAAAAYAQAARIHHGAFMHASIKEAQP